MDAKLLDRFDTVTFLTNALDRAKGLSKHNRPLHLSVRFGAGQRVELIPTGLRAARDRAGSSHVAFEVEGKDLDVVKAHLLSADIQDDRPRPLGPPAQLRIPHILEDDSWDFN